MTWTCVQCALPLEGEGLELGQKSCKCDINVLMVRFKTPCGNTGHYQHVGGPDLFHRMKYVPANYSRLLAGLQQNTVL